MLHISEPGPSLDPHIPLHSFLDFSSSFGHNTSWKSCINMLLPFPQLPILQTIIRWLLPSCSTKTVLIKITTDVPETKPKGISFVFILLKISEAFDRAKMFFSKHVLWWLLWHLSLLRFFLPYWSFLSPLSVISSFTQKMLEFHRVQS